MQVVKIKISLMALPIHTVKTTTNFMVLPLNLGQIKSHPRFSMTKPKLIKNKTF